MGIAYYACKVRWTIGILRTWNKYYYYITLSFIWKTETSNKTFPIPHHQAL